MDALGPILDLAASQHGVLGRYQLLPWLAPKRADDLLRTAQFIRVLHGVYRLRGAPALPEQDGFAAVLRARPGATLDRPARPPLVRRHRLRGGDRVPGAHADLRRPANVPFDHRLDAVVRRGVRTYGDIRVAGPLDALVDAAEFLGEIEERQLRLRGTTCVARGW